MEEPSKKRRTSEDLGIHNLVRNDSTMFYYAPQDQHSWTGDWTPATGLAIPPAGGYLPLPPSRGTKRSMIE
jgi:hypothetical protein